MNPRGSAASRNLDVEAGGATASRAALLGTRIALQSPREEPFRMAGGALILHDDEPTLALIRTLVEAAGLDAVAVSSPYRAAAAEATARLVVLGMTAVEERDLEIVPVLRQRWPDCWILVLFPLSLRERAARALELGADASLPEPFYPGELAAIAHRAAAREPPASAAPTAAPTDLAVASPGGSVQQLAAGVAHSIRNPLQILELQLGALEADEAPDIPGMREQVQRIATVVDGLARFSGHRNLTLRPVDLDQLVTKVFATRRTKGPEIALRTSGQKAEVLAAAELLRPGLEILRERAERVTAPGGRIDVRTQVRGEGPRRVFEIAVTDGGPTLSEEDRARLFDPYPDAATLQEGTGLELAALAGIVRDHGGTTAALPAAGGTGTTIVLRLPIRTEASGSSGAARP